MIGKRGERVALQRGKKQNIGEKGSTYTLHRRDMGGFRSAGSKKPVCEREKKKS